MFLWSKMSSTNCLCVCVCVGHELYREECVGSWGCEGLQKDQIRLCIYTEQ